MAQNTTILTGTYSTDFINGITYPVHKLRGLIGALIGKGVFTDHINSMKVIPQGAGKIKIISGRAMFEDGGLFAVDAEGVILEIPEDGCYVYLQNGYETGEAMAMVSKTAPGQDAIPLAVIDGNGTITDKRIFARMKIREE